MDKELLAELGIEASEDLSDEQAKQLIVDKFKEKDTQISTLESEKETLSHEKEELSTAVEEQKRSKENLEGELSQTKQELATTKGKLEQVTELYKENFTKDPEDETPKKDDKELHKDVLDAILDMK